MSTNNNEKKQPNVTLLPEQIQNNGFITDIKKQTITDGTKFDSVNPPKSNIDQKFVDAKNDALFNSEVEQEYAKKLRIEMQGFKYVRPDKFKNVAFLASTEVEPQLTSGDQINPQEGESIITIE